MKKSIALTIIVLALFTGCSKKETSLNILTVTVKCENTRLYTFQPLISGATIYIFDGINFNYPVIGGYEYLGNGIIRNRSTGVEISFSMKRISSTGIEAFEGLPDGSYGVIADISSIVKIKRASIDWNGTSIRLPESLPGYDNNTVKIVFDIWPYSVTDLGL